MCCGSASLQEELRLWPGSRYVVIREISLYGVMLEIDEDVIPRA